MDSAPHRVAAALSTLTLMLIGLIAVLFFVILAVPFWFAQNSSLDGTLNES